MSEKKEILELEPILCAGDAVIRPSGIDKCARCHVQITDENDSQWEVFVTGNLTQPICKSCHAKESKNVYVMGSMPEGNDAWIKALLDKGVDPKFIESLWAHFGRNGLDVPEDEIQKLQKIDERK